MTKYLFSNPYFTNPCFTICQSNLLSTALVSLADQLIIREHNTADATFTPLESKAWFENSANAWGSYCILFHKTNKDVSTVLCSVVKHLGNSTALKMLGKTLDFVACFSLHFFRTLPLTACFTTEQGTVDASLFVK